MRPGTGPAAASRGVADLPSVTGAPGDVCPVAGPEAEAGAAPGSAWRTDTVPGGPAALGGEARVAGPRSRALHSYGQGPGPFLAG